MRSLFVKIFLWFLLTVVVAVSGTRYVEIALMQRQQMQPQSSADSALNSVKRATPGRPGTRKDFRLC